MKDLDLSDLPESLAEGVRVHWQNFCDVGGMLDTVLQADVPGVWASSDYVATQLCRKPELATWLASGCLDSPLVKNTLAEQILSAIAEIEEESDLQVALRQLRHKHMVRIIWRDITRRARYHDTVADLSLLAEQLISAALDWLESRAREKDGTPMDDEGNPVGLVVLAMGKLGAGELNLSSDIDLIFAYEHEGETRDGRRQLTNHQFFLRLGQQLIKVLDQMTADGFVFRVDMRLRPWGTSGALAAGFEAIEGYYERQGREWERYALIKMRPVAGDLQAGARLQEALRPFVFRRYIDYGAFESLREMKGLIEREVRRKGIQSNVKLGPGGIREVEFIVQAFQLIRGGQVPSLRDAALLRVLPRLVDEGLLPIEAAEELEEAYSFLRDVEHRLQAVADRQTQTLPDTELEWQRLAFAMGYEDKPALEYQLAWHRDVVRRHFNAVIADPDDEEVPSQGADRELQDLWCGRLDHETALSLLQASGVNDPEQVLALLSAFRDGKTVSNMQRIARDRLDRLMPRLLETLGYHQGGEVTCQRLVTFLESVLRRSAYIALLVENPHALTQLVKLSAASPWIADQLARHPMLLDELLDVSSLYAPPQRQQLEDELHQQLLRIPEDDLEQQMEVLRHFKQAHLLKVAASEVAEVLPLMQVSDYLTWLAEAILVKVVNLAWKPLVARHGYPCDEQEERCDPGFAIVGYGKLGGIELGHNSDLDLVFLHDGAAGGMTNGGKSVSNEQFYARLGQRVIHILTTRTMSGLLYEVDTRLRPSGAAGLLVSSINAFERYQQDEAWTWEHQALVRARAIAGCTRTAARFEDIRHQVLSKTRDQSALQKDVRDMRQRMREHLSNRKPDLFHLKQDAGGIVDIEFVVQYGVLGWACRHGELTRYTDNIRLLETLAALELMPAQDAGLLREAYLAYRSAAHRLALRNENPLVDASEFSELRHGVCAIREKWF